MRRGLAILSVLGITMAILMIVVINLEAKIAPSLMERIEADLKTDGTFSEDERKMYLDAFRTRLAAYGRDIIQGEREQAAEVLITIVVEGSFGQAPVGRIVDVASAAYIAVRRGSDAEVVQGIALYGFRSQVDADRIEAWANGYGIMVKFGVPTHVAEDLVFQSARHGWDIYTFDMFKWGLVDAAREGYVLEDFQAYMIGTYLAGGERPGGMVARSMRYFRSLGGVEPTLPAYEGLFIPRENREIPAPRLDLTQQVEAAPHTGAETAPKGTIKESVPDERPDKTANERYKQAVPEEGPSGLALGYLLRIEGSYKKYLGVPYAWGGTTKQGMDCSGFVQRVFAEAGIRLPRSSQEQWKVGEPVARYAIREGDLVFFKTRGERISHVGIVTRPAEDEFIHASSSKGVSYALLSWRYFDKRYAGARRVVPGGLASSNGGVIYQASRLFVAPK